MFLPFEQTFTADQDMAGAPSHSVLSAKTPFAAFLNRFGGMSFKNGLYRVISTDAAPAWNTRMGKAFPEFLGRVECFSYDWLGRVYAVNNSQTADGSVVILCFEPAAGEAMEIPGNIISFHNEELVEFFDEDLSAEFYNDWLSAGGAVPRYDQCIGHCKPLFLGGEDNVQNLGLTDLDVYWTVCEQLIHRVANLPTGAKIDDRIS